LHAGVGPGGPTRGVASRSMGFFFPAAALAFPSLPDELLFSCWCFVACSRRAVASRRRRGPGPRPRLPRKATVFAGEQRERERVRYVPSAALCRFVGGGGGRGRAVRDGCRGLGVRARLACKLSTGVVSYYVHIRRPPLVVPIATSTTRTRSTRPCPPSSSMFFTASSRFYRPVKNLFELDRYTVDSLPLHINNFS
jgi:hypothetical protein